MEVAGLAPCGCREGPTEDAEVRELRERKKRNFMATLLLSQGVPMIAHGDELGRTQHGNNNVYCQDNPLSWIDWADARDNDLLTELNARLAALRRAHPVFRRQRFFQSRPIHGSSVDDIAWLRPDGQQMTDKDWTTGYARTVAISLNGQGIPDRDAVGAPVTDDSFLLLINAHYQQITFTLPDEATGGVGRSSSTPPTHSWPTPAAAHPPPEDATGCRPGPCRCSAAATESSAPDFVPSISSAPDLVRSCRHSAAVRTSDSAHRPT